MSSDTLYEKVFGRHVVDVLPTGQYQIFIGFQPLHDVTTSPAFEMVKEANGKVAYPQLNIATADHMVPTTSMARPFSDPKAEALMDALERNARQYGIEFLGPESGKQGIVHIIGPERGLTQPGITIACGDSHTSTHGAFGALAFGIGTTQVRYVLETQTLAVDRLKVRQIHFKGELSKGVYAKDVILYTISQLGVGGGKGFAYEYGGSIVDKMTMEERMTICNMSIEGGALVGYVNPDNTTFDYLRGRERAPRGEAFERAVKYWKSIASEPNAQYDDTVVFQGKEIEPTVTWGINPGHAIGISQRMPELSKILDESERKSAEKAYAHMKLTQGELICGTPIDVAFIGSCTNGRLSDLEAASQVLKGRKVADSVVLLVVPGSYEVKRQAEELGLDRIFTEAGAQWRGAGCSMCLGMNPDKLTGYQMSASSSNRNFIGRQGSPNGRTLLMSPAMVAAAAVEGRVTDVRQYLR
ncbi:3-isopropylmalate dehydratase large subunit [Candidatus Woesearchaeota archaeon]|nr:3-isopropylmalate dehydratase large subunit [Candidatus Woesearchaeota archaeon]